jgi:hypothetical protein
MLIDFLRLDSTSSGEAQGARLVVGAAIIAHSIQAGNHHKSGTEEL